MGGTDQYSRLEPYFLTMTYVDNCDGSKADDLQLQLADRDRRFISDWRPDIGATMDVGIICERWFAPNAAPIKLDCGTFWIDEMEYELPQLTVTVKATSIPTTAHLKANNETRGWEKTTLEDIVNQIAQENGMSVLYPGGIPNPEYRRVEQQEESALQFLRRRTEDAKLAIKIHRNQIVVFDEEVLESAPSTATIFYGDMPGNGLRLVSGHFIRKITDTQIKATVSHLNPDTGKNKNEAFDSAFIQGPQSAELAHSIAQSTFFANKEWDQKVNIHPEESTDEDNAGDDEEGDGGGRAETRDANAAWNDPSPGGAQRRAKSEVRQANKDREHATLQLSIGNPLVASGQVVTLVGFGQFDGQWFILSATHEIGDRGYTTSLEVRRCLVGY